MSQRQDRREFLKRSALAGASLAASHAAAGYFVNPLPAAESKSPNERLNLACVGTTGRAGANVSELSSQNIVALADVDSDLLEKGASRYPQARKYRDFRVMLEKEAEKIDAVVVGTPDHTHAPAAAMAMRMKKHCYCEKPLTHTVFEARTLSRLAAENKLVTQMGNQIHAGDNYRRVVELVKSGAIGKVTEVYVWANAKYSGAVFTTDKPSPATLDWDLWLGPAPQRPYTEGAHPFNWRRFWDYGTGALGDFGCHYMDLAHWALDLRAPTKVSAEGPKPDPVSAPEWCVAHYEYPARGDLPAVKLEWYDSGKQPKILPELLATLKDDKGNAPSFPGGQLFIGEKGMLLSDYGRHILLPKDKFVGFQAPPQTIAKSIGHHAEWVQAIKTGGTTTCNFDYAGALTEAVLLGVVAFRSGTAIEWDAAALKVKNSEHAQQFVHTEYRKGWTL
ncbi:MAG: Gfo/Idh/MocA family oxidoreductase [Pirellulales bacterium]